ncbi:hypothetical protein B0A58_01455, partial [Flavobacterium branchiophilum NBRC 15030 = ATCC 35035]
MFKCTKNNNKKHYFILFFYYFFIIFLLFFYYFFIIFEKYLTAVFSQAGVSYNFKLKSGYEVYSNFRTYKRNYLKSLENFEVKSLKDISRFHDELINVRTNTQYTYKIAQS